MTSYPVPPPFVTDRLREGIVIPAHPLALTNERKFDPRRQRALTRYYHAAGAGGIAVGVHATQFEIRQPKYELFAPVLELASETIAESDVRTGRQTVRVAGLYGPTDQAVKEAQLARELGYHVGLLSLATFPDADDATLIADCRAVAEHIPLFGFYLQPAAGGRVLSHRFWCQFVEIPNVVAIKVAPFNRYQTFDVVWAVAESGRVGDISLYTGNDDNIVVDLLTQYEVRTSGGTICVDIVGGLLGHWAYWTVNAVSLLEQCRQARQQRAIPPELLTLATLITDSNAAVFDAAHRFAGVNSGLAEVLRRQGLLANNLCLNPDEGLSEGQSAEIDRVYQSYPELTDDAFVRDHLHEWLD